ncbi:hypothetical protein NLJ89_g10274 [Agrocybe chaxingu]|uniref:Uncharacterized protein n=1 Tax=Agrocybe chaxingu TaxID=84603 RepID=A0A9W8JYH2_9AGAR|nr:hypothetical protein NLJ89_g10274 [Agrocybe chaxingu]
MLNQEVGIERCDAPPQPDKGAIDDAEHQQLAEILSSTMLKRTPRFDLPSPLSNVRMTEYSTTVAVTRHQACSDYSPYSSSPSTAVNSRAPSPTKELDEGDDPITTFDRLSWRLASGFFACFLGGWADGVTGTVMPYLSAEFNLTSTLSSSLFAASTCGFFAGTFLVETILKSLGRFRVKRNTRSICALFPVFSKRHADGDDYGHSVTQARFLVLVVASVIHAMYFVMMGSRSGFSVMFLAYVFSAFSRALLTAPLNAFFAAGPKQALGYGLGLTSECIPFLFISIIATGVPWYHFYYGSLALSAVNIAFLASTFRPTPSESYRERQDALREVRFQKSQYLRSGRSSPVNDTEAPAASTMTSNFGAKPRSALRLTLSMPYQWAFSFFILLYCGSETTTQGFMVTYLLQTRHANEKTVGLTFTQRKYTVHACIMVAVITHLLIWFIKSNIQNAVSTSLIGVLYGPIFPACLSMANDILPEEVHMAAMALISSFGSLGGAVFPLMTGAILDAKGVQTFTYVTVPLAAAMACLWTLFPSRLSCKPTLV